MKYIPLIFLFFSTIFSQNDFEFDYAQFYADSNSNLLEIYYELDPSNLIQEQPAADSNLVFNLVFEFSNSSGEKSWQDTVSHNHSIMELAKVNSYRNIMGIYKTILSEGYYDLKIDLIHSENNSIVANQKILVKKYAAEAPLISSIQLAKMITADTSNNQNAFTKNTLKVIPNSSSSYSSENPLLMYYCELYNLSSSNLLLSTFIVSSNQEVVFSERKDLESSANSIVQVDKINLLKYPTGIYTLQLLLTDSTSNYAFASQKQFYFYNKLYAAPLKESAGENKSSSTIFYFLSSEECDEIFDKSIYLATGSEIDQYEEITTVEGKREFLYNFWKNRSSDISGDAEKRYADYMKEIEKVNKKFKGVGSEGYKTEQGRVYLTYGEPSKVEQYPNASNLKPYEIWYYDTIEGGVIFVFGDLNGFGDFQLLHSTKRGEVYDDTWQRRLYIY